MPKSNIVQKFKAFISPGIIQFILAFILILLMVIDYWFNLFNISEFIDYSKTLFNNYGLLIIIVAAFIESFFMIGLYLPGSAVILLSVITSDYSASSLFKIGLYSLLGFTIANIANYYLGKFGYYKV